MDANGLFRQGVDAIKAKKLDEGKKLLHAYLKQNPDNASAWLWYSQTFSDPETQKKVVDRALKIDPNHAQALKLRQRLKTQKPAQTSAKQVLKKPPPNPSEYAEFSVYWIYQFVGIAWTLFLFFLTFLMFATLFGDIERNLILFTIISSSLILIPSIWMMRVTYTALNRKIEVFDNGIKISDLSDELIKWEDITAIRYADRQARMRLHMRLTPAVFIANNRISIRLKDNKNIRISEIFSRFNELQQLILSLSTPIMIERIERGETVSYGKIMADTQGLHKDDKTIAWEDVVKIKEPGIFFGRATIVSKDKVEIRQRVRNVWNIHLIPYLIASRQNALNIEGF